MIASIKQVYQAYQNNPNQYSNPNENRSSNHNGQQTSCALLCAKITKAIPIMMILLVLSDQISDIAYVVETWNQFPSVQLRNLAVFFCFYQTLALAAVFMPLDLIIFIEGKARQQYASLKIIGYCVVLVILYPLNIVFSIFKINQIIFKVILPHQQNKKLSKSYQQSSRRLLQYSEWMVIFVVADVLLESIPEFIIQFTTNQHIGKWSTIAKISFILSILTSIYAFVQVFLEFYSNGKQVQSRQTKYCKFQIIMLMDLMLCYFIIAIFEAIEFTNLPYNTDFWDLVYNIFDINLISYGLGPLVILIIYLIMSLCKCL